MGNLLDVCLNYFEEFYEYPVKYITIDQSYYYKNKIIDDGNTLKKLGIVKQYKNTDYNDGIFI